MNNVTQDIYYVGTDDAELDLFESQYMLENGVAYNSYIIKDEKIAVMDSVDARKTEEWLSNITAVLGSDVPDYLVVSHLEPDHSGSISAFMERYPDVKIVLSVKAATMLSLFTDKDYSDSLIQVKEGDTLSLGKHELQFFMAPMVHWPEVMVEYDKTNKVLFSADAFGKFGTLATDEEWDCEARRYYFNIVGKYGAPVQTLLKKAAALEIEIICPLHGPVLKENISYYIDKYNTWSTYTPEDKGILIAYASIYGNTKKAAEKLAEILAEKGAEKVVLTDLARDDMAEAVEDAFRYDRMVLMAASYDAGVFPCMEAFLNHLKAKAYQNRKVGIAENGSWAPTAGRVMKTALEGMKNITVAEPVVTIKGALKDSDVPALTELAEAML